MAVGYRKCAVVGLAIVALATAFAIPRSVAGGAGSVGDVYITSDASNVVRAYNGATGAFIGNHCAAVLGSGQLGIHFGPNNGLLLVGSFGGGVDEYNAATGGYIKTYAPTGGWQWAGIYAPNGNVYIGSMNTNDVIEYDAVTGAFVRVLCPVYGPADMAYGPNGHLYICSFLGGFVEEVHPVSGAIIGIYNLPAGEQANDIAFLPDGTFLVTAMGMNLCYHYSAGWALLGSFSGTGWARPHGIDISPANGNIYIVDGVTTQVHVFDPVTFTELNPAWRSPDPDDKIVDLEFRRDNRIVPVESKTWGAIKSLFN